MLPAAVAALQNKQLKIQVFLIALLLIGCTNHVTARDALQENNAIIEKDISYLNDAHKLQALDIYTPAKTGSRPVLIYIHGGAWKIGDKRSGAKHAHFYTNQGIVFVSVNYRMLPKFKHPTFVEDIAASIKWVTDNIHNYGGDRNKIVLTGHSAGAHLAALVTSTPKYLQAHNLDLNTIKAVAPVDTASFDFTLQSDHQPKLIKRIINKAFGRTHIKRAKASPRQYVLKEKREDYPDFLLFVTSELKDAIEQTYAFHDALKSTGANVQKFILQGASHSEMNDQISQSDSIIAQHISKTLEALR